MQIRPTDIGRQRYAQEIPREQLSEHNARPSVLHVNAYRPQGRMESDSIQSVRLYATRVRHELH